MVVVSKAVVVAALVGVLVDLRGGRAAAGVVVVGQSGKATSSSSSSSSCGGIAVVPSSVVWFWVWRWRVAEMAVQRWQGI